MKATILTFLTVISLAALGQNATPTKDDGGVRFTGRHVEMNPESKTVFLKEDVKIETENLVLQADSAVFDEEKQSLIAYGTKHLVFTGGETVISENAKNIVRYTLKDKILYIE